MPERNCIKVFLVFLSLALLNGCGDAIKLYNQCSTDSDCSADEVCDLELKRCAGSSSMNGDTCNYCHGLPPAEDHTTITQCSMCHSDVVNPDMDIIDEEKHINGSVDTNISSACNSCHGSGDNAAPPIDISGNTSTDNKGVGAHQAHISASYDCAECHIKPSSYDAGGHADTDLPAEVIFGNLAKTGGLEPVWDGVSKCSSVYCHGAALSGGGNVEPLWTTVDGTQALCGTCHGLPPTGDHTTITQCSMCHSNVVNPDMDIIDDEKHINGSVDTNISSACNYCHGSGDNAAPPVDIVGNTSTDNKGVGAHQAHISASYDCAECHINPSSFDDTGHADTDLPAEVVFGNLAKTGGLEPVWDGVSKCSSVYCHGATMSGGSNVEPLWTTVDGSQASCGTCHAVPPDSHSASQTACYDCHSSDGHIK